MRMSKCFFSTFLVYLFFVALGVQSQDDQSGFISIDCGIPGNSSYTDNTTDIRYVSDSGFTDAGESRTILPIYRTQTLEQQFLTLQSFPRGNKSCYTLKPDQGPGNRYLIRAWFMYGNYDSKGHLPEFDLHLGLEKWDTISFNKTTSKVFVEIIHVPISEYIHVCLVDKGLGMPFISALELRYFNSSMYTAEFGSLQLFARIDFGETFQYYRYKDDIYDRKWDSINYINSTLVYNFETWTTNPGALKVPYKVMRTGIVPDNASNPLRLPWQPSNASDQFLIYLHFSEVETLQLNETREFDIYLDGNLWYNRPVVPFNRTTITIASDTLEKPASRHEIVIQKTRRSTLPPIINAIELYTVKQFLQSQTNDQDVGSMFDIKSVYKVQKGNWQGDPCLPRASVWNGIGCNYSENPNMPRITSLNLSSSGLSGKIAPSISNLTMIRSLDLSNNNLSGEIPDFLSQLTFLRILNIQGNNFTGTVPSNLISKSESGYLLLSMDSSLGGEDRNQCLSSSCRKSSKKSMIWIAAPVVSVFVLILFTLIVILYLRRNRKPVTNDNSLETKKRQFTYSEIISITNNFETIVGKGGFGTVYHGYIDDAQVAVKMLSATSFQGYKEFQTEAMLLMNIHHKNLTALVGYCNEDNYLGIIYEYMANGDLEGHLAGRKPYVLSWKQRILIAIDAAEGFEYLHHGCKPPIVHRDVKSTNILLTENFQGKLADFGLSRVIPFEAGSHVTTVVAGTPGYLDPEYYRSSRLTEKSDVYSFGVVLLEIITGRPAIGTNDDRVHIVEWVKSRLEGGDIKLVIDSRIRENADINSIWKAVEIALVCVSTASEDRPTMNFVANQLKESLANELARTETRKKELDGVVSLNFESSVSGPQAR